MNSIFENNSFVVLTIQSDFVYLLCVNIMSARRNDINSHSFCVNIMIARMNKRAGTCNTRVNSFRLPV